MIDWREVIGLSATLFVILSFTQSNLKLVRYINIVGCILFIIYGLLIGALSVWILNGVCLLLHIYKLNKESKGYSGQNSTNSTVNNSN